MSLALNKFSPEQFNRQLQIGTVESTQNENTGANETRFKTQFTVWAMPYTRSMAQNLSLMGTDCKDSIQLVIRHNSAVIKQLVVQYNDQLYEIVNDSVDDSNIVISYDILTLQLIQKAGN